MAFPAAFIDELVQRKDDTPETIQNRLTVYAAQTAPLIDYYQEKGLYKYTCGESTDYNKVLRTKRQLGNKFKGAFIIAFKNGKKMDVNQAIKEFKNNR